eukprot:3881239-Rhodomonas_salina.1
MTHIGPAVPSLASNNTSSSSQPPTVHTISLSNLTSDSGAGGKHDSRSPTLAHPHLLEVLSRTHLLVVLARYSTSSSLARQKLHSAQRYLPPPPSHPFRSDSALEHVPSSHTPPRFPSPPPTLRARKHAISPSTEAV